MHPKRPAYVPLLPPTSLQLTAWRKKDTTACLPWMSQWPRISACPRLLNGEQKLPTRPNRVGRLQLSLDEPIIDSYRQSPERALAIQQFASSFKLGVSFPLKVFQRMLRNGLSVFDTSVGPASHAAPSVLAETSSFSTRLASRTPPCQGEPGLCCSSKTTTVMSDSVAYN